MKDCKKCSHPNFAEKMPPVKCDLPQAIQVVGPSDIVLFHRIDVPAALGDDTTNPPVQGEYKNILLVYEANGHAYLYNSDGIFTRIHGVGSFDELSGRPKYAGEVMTSATEIPDIGDMRDDIDNLITGLGDETAERERQDGLLNDAIGDEITARTNADDTLQGEINLKANSADLATVATTGQYSDLSGVPTNVSDFTNDSNFQTQTEVNDAISDATTPITAAINKDFVSELVVDNTVSSTVSLNKTVKNISTGDAATTAVALPVASSIQAGVMNAAMYSTLQDNAAYINAILNGAVSVSGLSANPSQADITAAWQTATGLANVINGAKVNDQDNQKVWTYYTNTATWYAASNTAQVTVNQFTNSAAGIIKGSTVAGQVYAENDGTGSVNGWDNLVNTVSGKQDALTAGSNITISSGTISATVPTVNNATLTIQKNGTNVQTFTANASSNKTANITVPEITLQTTDPGEGATLAANNFIAVYNA